jgi:predicted small integral membrane protein|tara:strand:+ start:339 stop:512 length:174 start_codon:yes stop_codon:yes gene_type:complete
MKKVLDFIKSNGFTALSAIAIGGVLWIYGFKIYAGIAFGVFLTRNWDILKGLLNKKK